MVIAAVWEKEQNLLNQNVKCYQEKWNRGHVLENSQAKLVWKFEFNLRKTSTSGRPNLMLEEKQTKTIPIYDMVWPQENNVEKKRLEKITNYRQLAFEIRESRPGFSGTIKEILKGLKICLKKMICGKRIMAEMQKTNDGQ